MGHTATLLAGDVGGTKTLLGLYEDRDTRPEPIVVKRLATAEYATLGDMIGAFLESAGGAARVEAACFGLAGPVRGSIARLTNADLTVDADAIAGRFSIPHVRLLNDLAAMAYAVPVLHADERASLQTGDAAADGNAALIAPGTGLGEALLHRVGGRFIPSPSEGGHADFAARTPREVQLLEFLTARFGRAAYEQVLSGPGLANLYRFVHQDRGCRAVDPSARDEDLPKLVSAAALEGRCAPCMEALDLFVSILGAESGNLALRSVATAGLYIGGGIASAILPALETDRFLAAFRSKPPMAALVADVPVAVILQSQSALLGAAVTAAELTADNR